jgi:hypothetical protein
MWRVVVCDHADAHFHAYRLISCRPV